MLQAKICLLGSFAVGKTSLASRFVTSIFPGRYQTTVGVRIDKKQVTVAGRDLTLVLWDIAGEDAFHQVRDTYLRGATGYFLVIDGTRRRTWSTAMELQRRAHQITAGAPFVVLLNKADQRAQWELAAEATDELEALGWSWQVTSALSGDGVEAAFQHLADRVVAQL